MLFRSLAASAAFVAAIALVTFAPAPVEARPACNPGKVCTPVVHPPNVYRAPGHRIVVGYRKVPVYRYQVVKPRIYAAPRPAYAPPRPHYAVAPAPGYGARPPGVRVCWQPGMGYQPAAWSVVNTTTNQVTTIHGKCAVVYGPLGTKVCHYEGKINYHWAWTIRDPNKHRRG